MIYKFKQNRVFRSYYGGKRLDALCGKENCEDSRFPEEWVASTVRAFNAGRENIVEGISMLEDGTPFSEIMADKKLPILVKLLDAAERLFIQCHPTVSFAKEHFDSDFGKTECWYIISAEEGACVYLGFKEGITKEKWRECFKTQNIEEMLSLMHKLSVSEGDLVFVEGGLPHAIGGGCLLCELQEPTDLMVIPERTSKSGITLPDIKLHGGLGFDKMFDCFTYKGLSETELRSRFVRHPMLKINELTPIVDASLTDKFRMDGLRVSGECALDLGEDFAVLTVIAGKGFIESDGVKTEITSGNGLFMTENSESIVFSGDMTLTICRA